jgi:hypothetical protein
MIDVNKNWNIKGCRLGNGSLVYFPHKGSPSCRHRNVFALVYEREQKVDRCK